MSPVLRNWFAVTALLGFIVAFACRSEGDQFGKDSFAPSPGLDGMQLESAGRVALESAADAMARRDLQRLKMLAFWVRERAQVVLFKPNDLSALDLAIACLERSVPPSEALTSLGKLTSGKLLVQARGVCSEPQ